MAQRWFRGWRALGLAALALLVLVPCPARADGSDEPPGENERVITIGPQAVVIMNDRGQLRMYDDPSQQGRTCKSSLSCLGQALGVYGVAAILAFDSFTIIGPEANVAPRRGLPLE